jgi:hypothetical protein
MIDYQQFTWSKYRNCLILSSLGQNVNERVYFWFKTSLNLSFSQAQNENNL